MASTDLPLRTCVYPSYNIDDGDDKPAILLASYTWSQDATRMGSMIGNAKQSDRGKPKPPSEAELIELIIFDLSLLHQKTTSLPKIKEAFTGEYHAWSWPHDPHAAGAFALFAPGQFSNLYPFLSRPTAQSKFHIVGEASSSHHAWIVGALDSAHGAVYQFLYRYRMWDAMRKLEKNWGKVADLEIGKGGTAHLQVALGALGAEEYVRAWMKTDSAWS